MERLAGTATRGATAAADPRIQRHADRVGSRVVDLTEAIRSLQHLHERLLNEVLGFLAVTNDHPDSAENLLPMLLEEGFERSGRSHRFRLGCGDRLFHLRTRTHI